MDQIAGRPYWQLHFDKDGAIASGPGIEDTAAAIEAAGVKDLFVMSHGWGNSETVAANLYKGMFPLIAQAAPGAMFGGIGFLGIFWPSLWFPDTPADQAPQATVQAVAAGKPGAADALASGKEIAAALRPAYEGDAERQAAVTRIGELIDQGHANVAAGTPRPEQEADLAEFHGLLSSLVTARPHAKEDGGEWAAISSDDPEKTYTAISNVMGGGPAPGSAQGLGDIFGKVWHGAKDMVRVASYYEMKNRAGDVGAKGLAKLLVRLGPHGKQVRVHLVGHSFGARLVAFSLSGIPSAEASPVGSLTLVQGAFSHWAFSSEKPYGEQGKLAGVADRVHGPLLSTFSKFDWAVGRWYPKASFLARQAAEAEDDFARHWGGMGGDGFHGVPVSPVSGLQPDQTPYGFAAGTFYPIDGANVIADVKQSVFSGAHSDIQHPQVAWAIVAAASAAS